MEREWWMVVNRCWMKFGKADYVPVREGGNRFTSKL